MAGDFTCVVVNLCAGPCSGVRVGALVAAGRGPLFSARYDDYGGASRHIGVCTGVDYDGRREPRISSGGNLVIQFANRPFDSANIGKSGRSRSAIQHEHHGVAVIFNRAVAYSDWAIIAPEIVGTRETHSASPESCAATDHFIVRVRRFCFGSG